jgi:hypothetical protein
MNPQTSQHVSTPLAAALQVSPPRATISTVELFAERHPAFTAPAVRNLIFKAEPRKSSRGEIPGNGLIEAGAILRVGRKVLIDEDRFFAWVRSQNGAPLISAPSLPLHGRPRPRIEDLIRRLDQCEPHSPEAVAVYHEAAKAGLVEDLREGLRRAAAASRREAHLLEAEMLSQRGSK